MNDDDAFSQAVSTLCDRDRRYDPDAYFFLRDAMAKAMERIHKAEGAPRHLTGQELSHGMRDHALTEFGPMAMTVMTEWGLSKTEDFGNMVYNLIGAGILGKTDADRQNDFAAVFDFTEVFVLPYLPENLQPKTRK
jgi:uncharacterized repeat protein (TIGR04138 family)